MISEGQTRIFINKQLENSNWDLTDPNNVQIEEHITETGFADYVLKNNKGHPLAVLEAKREGKDPRSAETQAKNYAEKLKVPFLFLSNGNENYFWDYLNKPYPTKVKNFFTQKELEIKYALFKNKVDIESVKIDRNIIDRDYQIECVNVLSKNIKNSVRDKYLIEMATGCGKTRIATALIKRLFQSNYINKVLFICDRNNLVEQAEGTFNEYLGNYSNYVLRAGKYKHENQIVISTLQTFINCYNDLNSGYFDLIIIDECHRSIYGQFRKSLDFFSCVKVGLTATPCSVSQDFDNQEDKEFIRDTFKFFEIEDVGPTFSYTMEKGISEGFLIPYKTYEAKTIRTSSEDGVTIYKNEIDWDILDDNEKKFLEEIYKDKDEHTFGYQTLERKISIPKRNKSIVKEFKDIMTNGYTDEYGKTHLPPKNGKTIVFAVNQRHAITLAQYFDEEFRDEALDATTRYADFVVSDLNVEDSQEAKMKIKKFKEEEFPKILVSVDMIDTGFDFSDITKLIFARHIKSNIKYRQMRGRGTRPAPHLNKKIFWMFDFVGNFRLHGDKEISEGGLVTTPGKRKTNPNSKFIEIDVDDWIDPTTRAIVTVDEEGNIVPTPEEEKKKSELNIRYEKFLNEQGMIDNNFEKDELFYLIGQRIKANPLEVSKIDDSFFSSRLFNGKEETIKILGGVEKYNDFIDKINRAIF